MDITPFRFRCGRSTAGRCSPCNDIDAAAIAASTCNFNDNLIWKADDGIFRLGDGTAFHADLIPAIGKGH